MTGDSWAKPTRDLRAFRPEWLRGVVGDLGRALGGALALDYAPICRVLSAVGDAIRWREYLMRSSDT